MHPRSCQSAILPPRHLRASTAPCNIAIDLPIAIVGGGLTRHDIAHKIYEAAGCFGEVNVWQALQAIDPRLQECFESCATRNCDKTKSKSWLSFRYVPNGSIRFSSAIPDVQAEGPSEYGPSCEFAHLIPEEDDGTAVKLTFKDGAMVWASAVLGCDRISSNSASIRPTFYCYQNLVPLHEAQRILGDEMATNENIFCEYVWHKPKWPLLDSRAAGTYTRGRLCLLDDAAHASTPHQGAGTAVAFEDAYSMTYLLDKASGSQNLTEAFCAFDKFRRPRTQSLVSTSRAAGQASEFTHKEIMDNIDSICEKLKRVYRQWKAIWAARQLWEEQSIDVTAQEVPSDGDGLDSGICSDDEDTDEEFRLLSECRF